MDACTSLSTAHLFGAALKFLAAVVSLDIFWVRSEDQVHGGDIAEALRKRSWLNALVAAGAGGAVILLFFWISTCAHGGVLAHTAPCTKRGGAKTKSPGLAGLFHAILRRFKPSPLNRRDARRVGGARAVRRHLHDRGRRHFGVNLLRVMEAAAERDRRDDDGENNDHAHNVSL